MLAKNPEYILHQVTKGWSIEVTPNAAKKIDNFAELLQKNTTVNVTFLPNSNPLDTIEVCKRLFKDGMNPVPHISARSIKNFDELDSFVKQLSQTSNVSEVLVISGSLDSPIGEFHETMQILNSGILQKYNIEKVGVAGHPEGSPDISDALIGDSLKRKFEWSLKEDISLYLETQFSFDATPGLLWEKSIRNEGIKLPIRIGVPGPANIKTLFQFARSSGVGASIKMIAKQSRNISKLLMVQAPDKYIFDLANGINMDKECMIENLHFYPFGGFKRTVEWISGLENGNFIFDGIGGFKIRGF